MKNIDSNNSKINYIKYSFNIINDSYVKAPLNETFIAFNTINNLQYLVYSSKSSIITCYDLINFQKIFEIKEEYMQNCRYVNFKHYLDKNNKRDLVISIFCISDNIKLWDVRNWECILNLKNINNSPDLGCACFINDNNVNYIIASCRNNKNESRPIKVFDFNGNKIKEINESKEAALYIDSYKDIISLNSYIISCNLNHLKSYDFKTNKVYHIYSDSNKDEYYCYTTIINRNEVNLIASCYDGNIRIFDFHSGILLNKINNNSHSMIFEICPWKNDYLFVGYGDNTIKLIDINNKTIVTSLSGHNNAVVNVKRINHPKYGECILSQGRNYDKIILWILK